MKRRIALTVALGAIVTSMIVSSDPAPIQYARLGGVETSPGGCLQTTHIDHAGGSGGASSPEGAVEGVPPGAEIRVRPGGWQGELVVEAFIGERKVAAYKVWGPPAFRGWVLVETLTSAPCPAGVGPYSLGPEED